ncbi:site-specific integrase [Streptomyces sp. NBC_00988]|uniref:tyrosine-type recombinase/integrase n=1 Tax=Streptomyces sp. NBC_00988 TaxID=2903704 RepID=UPI003864CB5E|nr:site-specific integrase [Streptomyces sp. NBC_00988]
MGQHSVEFLIDRHQIESPQIRDMLVEYLKERQPQMDYSSLSNVAYVLAGHFWRDLEIHHPGISSLHLDRDIAAAWKQRHRTIVSMAALGNGSNVEVHTPRRHAKRNMTTIRAFYLDIAQWAVEEPVRWGQWAAPCPITQADIDLSKDKKKLKSRMDQRTRERLSVLPILVKSVAEQRSQASARLAALLETNEGDFFTVSGETFQRVRPASNYKITRAISLTDGRSRDLATEESDAFWGWAVVEVLRHTGIRAEELNELSHHSITQYRLPDTGEVIPLLQIAPSKTDQERLLLVSPELADVLSTIVCRVRVSGRIPLVPFYDYYEKIWHPPAPQLFQRVHGGADRAMGRSLFARFLKRALALTGLTDSEGKPLHYQLHDFRRMFVTDAVMNGLPPHIAQIICGHKDINTTMGYKAIYPEEAIRAHRSFIARRRTLRPSEEYRTPTNEEWDAFLSHFEKRKLSVGTCARAFGTPCIHEHACVRCSMLRPDPSQRPRLVEIRDNLLSRIGEAEREGWFGEVEGLHVSLAGAEEKLSQLDSEAERRTVSLGMPSFDQITGRL